MKRLPPLLCALLLASAAPAQVGPGAGCTVTSCAASNGSSTLTSGTNTSLTAGLLIASNPVVVPSFTLLYNGGSAIMPKMILTASPTSGWSGGIAYVELWSAAPTFTNSSDGGVYAIATGSGNYLGTLTCTFGPTVGSATLGQGGDGAYAECVPYQGTVMMPKLASGNTIFWTLIAGSTLTKASGATFTLKPAAALN